MVVKKEVLIMVMAIMSGNSSVGAEVASETQIPNHRLYVALEEKQSSDEQIKNLYRSVKEMSQKVDPEKLCFFPYQDQSGMEYKNISAFPFIVLKGNATKVSALANLKEDLCYKTIEAGKAVCLFGSVDNLQSHTKRLSIYNPKDSLFPPYKLSEDLEVLAPTDLVLLSDQLKPGSQLNTFAHLVVGSGHCKANQVDYGAIEEEKLSKLFESCKENRIPHIGFLHTMHLGPTYKEQIQETKKLSRSQVRITGLYMNGTPQIIKNILRQIL